MEEILERIAYLKRKLNTKRERVLTRYSYYESKNLIRDLGISTPPELRCFESVMGWAADAVDAIGDRLQFYRFDNDLFDFGQIFERNNQDVFVDSAILSALIGSCSFAYISPDENGLARIEIIDGRNATGEIDPYTSLLKDGYAVLERDKEGRTVTEAYFNSEFTLWYRYGKLIDARINPAKYPLLVPIIYKPDSVRPFGHSVISRSMMSSIQGAARTIKRSEISAEFYSFPQKYVTGLAEDAEIENKWKAAMSAMLSFTKDEDGEHPVVGQFAQQSMTPHIEQLKMFASKFAGESGLTMEDIGFPLSNPSSAEAIKAAHEKLRLKCRKAQRNFSVSLKNIGYIARSLEDQKDYARELVYSTKVLWEPIFEPDANMLASIGDGILKVNQAMPEYISEDKARGLLGF